MRATRAILLWATPVGLRPTGLRPVLFYIVHGDYDGSVKMMLVDSVLYEVVTGGKRFQLALVRV